MKNYIVKTLMVSLPEESITESIVVTLPNNAMPIGIEVRPAVFPGGFYLHHLIPCDEQGNVIEEVVEKEVTHIYETAWNELYKLYSERLDQDNLNVMDSVLKGVISEMESEIEAQREG